LTKHRNDELPSVKATHRAVGQVVRISMLDCCIHAKFEAMKPLNNTNSWKTAELTKTAETAKTAILRSPWVYLEGARGPPPIEEICALLNIAYIYISSFLPNHVHNLC